MAILRNGKALYINGAWQAASELEAVVNPANEDLVGEAPVGHLQHAEAALAAAR